MLNGDVVSVSRNVREYGEPCFSGDIVTLPTYLPNSDRTGQDMPNTQEPVDMLYIGNTSPNLHNVFVQYGSRTFLGVLNLATETVYFRTDEDLWLGTVKSGPAGIISHSSRYPVECTVSHRDVTTRTYAELLDEAYAVGQTGSNMGVLGRRGMMWCESDRTYVLDILCITEYFSNNPPIR